VRLSYVMKRSWGCEIYLYQFALVNGEKFEEHDLRNVDKREVRLKWDGVVTSRIKAAAQRTGNSPIAGDVREERRGLYGKRMHRKEQRKKRINWILQICPYFNVEIPKLPILVNMVSVLCYI